MTSVRQWVWYQSIINIVSFSFFNKTNSKNKKIGKVGDAHLIVLIGHLAWNEARTSHCVQWEFVWPLWFSNFQLDLRSRTYRKCGYLREKGGWRWWLLLLCVIINNVVVTYQNIYRVDGEFGRIKKGVCGGGFCSCCCLSFNIFVVALDITIP